MISELALDLYEKLKSVPALENRIGLNPAGGASDPSMSSVPMPAAWLIYDGDGIFGEEMRTAYIQDYVYNFSVELMVSKKDQADLINTQLPTIEAIARSVVGQESTDDALRWTYQGAQLVDVFDDRFIYLLRFSTIGAYF